MFNVATTIANQDIISHVLVLSRKEGEKWMRATGQDENPNVHLQVLGNGQWEDWHPAEPRELVIQIRSPEYNQAVRETFEEIRRRFPSDRITAIISNPLMGGLPILAKELQLQFLVLNPSTGRLLSILDQNLRRSLDPKFLWLLEGIADPNGSISLW